MAEELHTVQTSLGSEVKGRGGEERGEEGRGGEWKGGEGRGEESQHSVILQHLTLSENKTNLVLWLSTEYRHEQRIHILTLNKQQQTH